MSASTQSELNDLKQQAKYLRAELEKAADTDFLRAVDLQERIRTIDGKCIRLRRKLQAEKRQARAAAGAT